MMQVVRMYDLDSEDSTEIFVCEPEDSSSPQVFQIPYDKALKRVRVQFDATTDFYGRVILYKLRFR